ncbi:diaminopimelate epimerase [Enemella sp. A6]|uniref:diaminopimelate epimerase n=1 Tax=Enemella sp. A6 TaxID=3440152 RepID=UPI003EC14891
MTELQFAKGHGTENDFVILSDRDGAAEPSAAQVRWLCNRHAGIGGDGLLRAVRAGHIADWDGDPDIWFMDYRNADGSIAEMCGNGLRVFVRYLLDRGRLEESDRDAAGNYRIGTRAGERTAAELPDGRIRVSMGAVTVGAQPEVIETGGQHYSAVPIDVGNPHAVVFADRIDDFDLSTAPCYSAESFPHGVNVEFATLSGDGARMRVFERGVGETRSCGTGTVAVAAAAAIGSDTTHWVVEVPGGTVEVDLPTSDDPQAYLTGPAEIVAFGVAQLPDTA